MGTATGTAISSELYQQLVDFSPQPMLVQCHGAVVFANAAMAAMSKLPSVEMLIGQDSQQFIHPDSREYVASLDPAQLDPGTTYGPKEIQFLFPDGTSGTSEFSLRVIEWQGEPAMLFCIRDISEKVRIREELEVMSERYRHLIDQSPDAIIVSQDSKVVLANPAFLKMVGAESPEQVIGKPSEMFAGGAPRAHRINLQTSRSDGVSEDELGDARRSPFNRLDGTEGIAEASVGEIVWKDEPAALVSIRDVTEQVALEQALRDEEARFQTLFEHAAEAILVFDTDDEKFIGANQNALTLFGLEREGISDLALASIISKADQESDRVPKTIEGVLRGEVVVLEAEMSPLDASRVIQCEVRFVKLPDAHRNLLRASITDIGDRKNMEEALQQAQKMEAVGQLTGGVAHDFNNLLTVVMGNLELLISRANDQSGIRKLAGAAFDAAEKGAELTQRLLAFSRRQALQPETIYPNKLIGGMKNLLDRTLGEPVSVSTSLGVDLWPVFADPIQLESALLNLAINARDAMPGGGQLLIETSNVRLDAGQIGEREPIPPGNYVQIAITDTGAGMSENTLARAFDPFFTTKDVGKGSGLGLSMVYGFVKQSGGTVTVYSEVGKGTVIKVFLPVDPAYEDDAQPDRHGRAPDSTVPADAVQGREHILVVEDNPEVREFVEELLQDLGYTVTATHDADEAFAFISGGGEADLLFTDIVLPGGTNGKELADTIGEIRPDLPVLFTSGYSADALIKQGRLADNVALLSKPYRRAELAEKLREVIEERPPPVSGCGPDSPSQPAGTKPIHDVAAPLPDGRRLLIVDDDAGVCELIRTVAEEAGLIVEMVADGNKFADAFSAFQPDLLTLDLIMPDSDGIEVLRWLAAQEKHPCILIISGYDAGIADSALSLAAGLGLDDVRLMPKPVLVGDLRAAFEA